MILGGTLVFASIYIIFASICFFTLEGLEFMGITCDEEKNNTRGEERIISKDGAPVTVMVIPTNEELMIAQDTLSIVEENKNK